MIKFLCLGSGSSGNSYYLKTEKCSILIDAGIPIRTLKKTLWDYGFSLEAVDGIFITHDHADHIKAVGQLANDMGKLIYATEKVHIGINNNYCTTSKVQEPSRRYLYKGETIQIGDLMITPFEVSHDSSDCVGYRIQQGELTFCLATDVGEVTPTVAEAITDANYLVLEANHDEEMLQQGPYPNYLKARIRSARGHLSNRQCADALVTYASPRLRQVWLCHLSEENNHPELARKTVEAILRSYGIVAGSDFALEVLNRQTPTGTFELA
ncbi:MAG: MBL fold metallo-hydrolase [Bacteroidaceae bacterium]|nr:MBL fold metallo-hydrolase [Bacteroidaceae bacterium]